MSASRTTLISVTVSLMVAAGAAGQARVVPALGGDLELQVWRATTRLERGDVFLAAPEFAQLHEEMRGSAGPTPLLVAEGVVRCELASGNAAGAVAAWLTMTQLLGEGWTNDGFSKLAPVMDEASGLIPTLAPVWLAGPELAALMEESFGARFVRADAPVAERVRSLASLYQRAAQFELGKLSENAGRMSGERNDASVELVEMIVWGRIGDEDQRAVARTRMELALKAELSSGGGSWREAWLRAGLGRSYLRESERDMRDRGILELLQLPARFAVTHPRLAAVALAEVSREYAMRKDRATAGKIAQLLADGLAEPEAILWLEHSGKTAAPSGAAKN